MTHSEFKSNLRILAILGITVLEVVAIVALLCHLP